MSRRREIDTRQRKKPLKVTALKRNPKIETCGVIYGNVWIFKVALPNVGDSKGKHEHEFDHIHYTVSGRAKLIIYKSLNSNQVVYEKTLTADEYVKVPKHHVHQIIALEGGYMGHCIHAVRDGDSDVLDTDFKGDIEAELRLDL